MKLSGRGTISDNIPLVIYLDRQINCFNKPSLVLFDSDGATSVFPSLCFKGRTLYTFNKTFLIQPHKREVLRWEDMKITENSPKYINQIIIYGYLGIPMEVSYQLYCDDEEYEFDAW